MLWFVGLGRFANGSVKCRPQTGRSSASKSNMARRKRHIGSDFDELLAEDGILEHTTAVAIKRVIAWQIQQIMKAEGISKKRRWPRR